MNSLGFILKSTFVPAFPFSATPRRQATSGGVGETRRCLGGLHLDVFTFQLPFTMLHHEGYRSVAVAIPSACRRSRLRCGCCHQCKTCCCLSSTFGVALTSPIALGEAREILRGLRLWRNWRLIDEVGVGALRIDANLAEKGLVGRVGRRV